MKMNIIMSNVYIVTRHCHIYISFPALDYRDKISGRLIFWQNAWIRQAVCMRCSGARARMHKSSAQNVCTVKFREGCRTSNSQREQGPTSTGTGTGVVCRSVSVGDTTVRPYRYVLLPPPAMRAA